MEEVKFSNSVDCKGQVDLWGMVIHVLTPQSTVELLEPF